MFEAIEYYQSLAEKFDSRIMFVPVIAVIIVGICIWLSGLRWCKVLGAIAGGSFLAAIGLCLGGYGCAIILIVAVIGAVIGAMIEKIMLGIFGVVMTCVVVLTIVSIFFGTNTSSDSQNFTRWPQYEERGVVIGFCQMLEITKTTGSFVLSKMIANLKSASLLSICAASMSALVAGFAAVIIPRVFIAIISSSLGSAVIFAGTIMLMFYKGSKPLNFISEKGLYYTFVIFIMLVFGTMVQLMLSPPVAEQTQKKALPDKNGDKK